MQKEQVETILDDIGVSLNVNGYKYLVDSVLELDRNPFLSTGKLYEIVAKENSKNKTAIERGIRFIHEKLEKEIKEYFNLKCKMNNSVLIKVIYREVKRKEENICKN